MSPQPGDRRPRCVHCDLPLCNDPLAEDCGGGVCHRDYNGHCDAPPAPWRQRALDAEAALAEARRDARRERESGLLAAAWVCPECDCSDSWTLRGRHSTECAAWVRDEIAALADNGPPMAACADCDGFGGFSVYGKPSGTIVRPCETCDGEGWLAQEADRGD